MFSELFFEKVFQKHFSIVTKKSAAENQKIFDDALRRSVSCGGQTIDTAFSIGVLSASG